MDQCNTNHWYENSILLLKCQRHYKGTEVLLDAISGFLIFIHLIHNVVLRRDRSRGIQLLHYPNLLISDIALFTNAI
jgi:hypothetical protein